MSISYANIAANAGSTSASPETVKPETTPEQTVQGSEQIQESSPETKKDTEKEKEKEKEKKILAPAPVPTKSAWGATSTPIATSTSSSSQNVDDHKWPTPDKVENDISSKSGSQKFIKPSTNKWVPINAKVTLATPRPNGNANNTNNQQKNKRKNNKNKRKSTSGQPSANPDQAQNQDQSHSQDDNISGGIPNSDVNSGNLPVEDDKEGYSNGHVNGQDSKLRNGQSNGAQKNFRRFNNQEGQFKPRYNNGNTQIYPQNGYYNPQPYAQNQYAYNNRQYRPQNGQYRKNSYNNTNNRNGNYRDGSIGNGTYIPNQFIPQYQQVLPPFANAAIPPYNASGIPPVQIPPPISPKQDPQQALTQQIDYYFSLENLIRDVFLRKNMDSELGWVPLQFILNFKRVKIIINGIQNSLEGTDEIQKQKDLNSVILQSVKSCENLETDCETSEIESKSIDDIRVRVKANFEQWLLADSA